MLLVNMLISGFACVYCLQTLVLFMYFISTQSPNSPLTTRGENALPPPPTENVQMWDRELGHLLAVLSSMLWDVAVTLVFVVQHRVMAAPWWRNLLSRLGVETAQRALYVIATCWTLKVVMSQLVPVPGPPIWDMQAAPWLCGVLWAAHVVAWVLLYGTIAVMDPGEMVGLKQPYHVYRGLAPPLAQKSTPARRLYAHMRHGGATCLLVLLWAHPLMTPARVVIATTLSLFVLCGFTVQEVDYVYLREQFVRKRITLRMQRSKTIELIN